MQTELNNLVNSYLAWLKDRTVLRQIDDWFEITTPYLDRHNDYLQIYAKKQLNEYVLTDDGYTIQDLKLSGCDLESEKRLALLGQILNGFSVQREGDALVTYASAANFPVRKHNLVQAMLSVDDLFYLARPAIASLFFDDVAFWLDAHEIRYIPNVKLTGRSGFDYHFDFVIPKSRSKPERIVSTINNPDRLAVQKAFMAWIDTKDVRPVDAESFAFINDTFKAPSNSVLQALSKYDIHPVLWSNREEVISELAH